MDCSQPVLISQNRLFLFTKFKGRIVLKKYLSKIISVALIVAMMLALAVSVSAAPWEENGAGLSELEPEAIGVVFGGNQITKGQGFLGNFRYVTEAELDEIRYGGSGTHTYKFGLGDSFTETPILYSTYENHGTPTYNYRYAAGLDIKTIATALGIDTAQSLSVEAKATDGSSTVLADAFGFETTRYSYDIYGERKDVVMPILALFETELSTFTAPSKESPATVPAAPDTGSGSDDVVRATFGYGQTSTTEESNCQWIKYINKLRIGGEDVALTIRDSAGKTITTSISEIVRRGEYRAEYSFESGAETVTHNVLGIPLAVLLDEMNIEVPSGYALQLQSASDTKTVTKDKLDSIFAAWSAQTNGRAVSNATAIRLYGAGQYERDVVFTDLTAISIVEAADESAGFTDIAAYGWAQEAIDYLAKAGIVNGTTATTYAPGNNITRADFMLMLYRAYDLGEIAEPDGNFADVPAGAYYYDAVAAARALEIAKGDGASFNPQSTITRQEAMTLLSRTLQAKERPISGSGDLSSFSDAGAVADWAEEAVTALVGADIVNGSGGKINPMGNMTRAEMAQVLYKALTKIV